MAPPAVKRNIYFFRADIGRDDKGELLPFDPQPALRVINRLPFTNTSRGRYEPESDGNMLCVFYDKAEPNQLQFARIRRTGLPQIEQAGNLSDLPITPDAGLSEPIQVLFFPRNIVGVVYNHFGPRLSRLGSYLHFKSNGTVPLVRFWPILNQDITQKLNQLQDVRLFEFSVQPSSLEVIKRNDRSLWQLINASSRFQDPRSVIHVVATFSKEQRETVVRAFTRRARRLMLIDDLQGSIQRLRLHGKRRDTGKVDNFDLLREQLISEQSIVRLNPRGRALDPKSAFDAIGNAYTVLQDDIERGSFVEP